MTGGKRYRAAIAVAAVSVVELDVWVVGPWAEDFPSEVDGYVPSTDDIAFSGLISPPLDALGSFTVIVNVQNPIKVV